jgi:hypothetical protein
MTSEGPRTAAVMQPYFLPYIGYYQLLAASDVLVVYDTIKYTKKGWINRNRFLRNGAPSVFTLPLQHGSDDLDIRDRWIAPQFEGKAILRAFEGSYRRAPHFAATMDVLEPILLNEERNLFRFIDTSIALMSTFLEIDTHVLRSSQVDVGPRLRGKDRVLALCEAVHASRYVNPIGGTSLYDRAEFSAKGIELRFLQVRPLEYPQFDAPFVPDLSIVDVLMFIGRDRTSDVVRSGYDLI